MIPDLIPGVLLKPPIMSTSTKSRATPAPQPVLLRTPEPKSRMKAHLAPGSVARVQGALDIEAKQGILAALDLEGMPAFLSLT